MVGAAVGQPLSTSVRDHRKYRVIVAIGAGIYHERQATSVWVAEDEKQPASRVVALAKLEIGTRSQICWGQSTEFKRFVPYPDVVVPTYRVR